MTSSDQFAYRPTGSPVAAIINIFHKIAQLLENNPYVTVLLFGTSVRMLWTSVRHMTQGVTY